MSPHCTRIYAYSISRTRGTTIFPAIIALLVIAAFGLLALRAARMERGTIYGKAPADIRWIERGCEDFPADNGGRSVPSLAELVRPDSPVRARIGTSLPRDPWGREYRYEPPNAEFDFPRIWTFGRDGLPGGEDDDADLGNWMLR